MDIWPRDWKGARFELFMTALRVALGVIFFVGGLKLAMPSLFGVLNHEILAQGYVDPATGWISPLFAEKISDLLAMPISRFLEIQGWVEMLLGVLMIVGLFTPMIAVSMGLMFWSFTVANPVVGEIRLSRDIALMGLCFSVALAGASRWSVDGLLRPGAATQLRRREFSLLLIRLGVAYTLAASALFFGGVLDNPLNTTLPIALVFVMGVALAAGVFPRWLMLTVGLWMFYLLLTSMVSKGPLLGLDTVKRELGLLLASVLYFAAGPDRWAWPKQKFFQCESIADLVVLYLDDELERAEQQAFEAHIADCPECWRFLGSYRLTVNAGQSLRQEDIPAEMHLRLEGFIRERLQA